MQKIRKKLEARFYQTHSGNQPVLEWIRDLSTRDKKEIGEDIAAVEFMWPIGMPRVRPMKQGLFELRCHLSGDRIARIMFGIIDGKMLLLHAFIKKTQQTPLGDLSLARNRLEEVEIWMKNQKA